MKKRFKTVRTKKDLIELVNDIGFLPFFRNPIEGFSLEDIASPKAWYDPDWTNGIKWPCWQWKGEVTWDHELAYAKLFRDKAGFVSLEWLADLCNYRRDGYEFEERYGEGLAPHSDKEVVELLREAGPMFTKEIKQALGYRKGGRKGFETIITRLQMETYVTVTDFEKQVAKDGTEYGWGVGRYALTEDWWGEEALDPQGLEPEESLESILRKLKCVLPDVSEADIRKFLK